MMAELPVFVDIAPGASPAGTPDSWEPYWVDVTKDVRVASGIDIEEGIPDEANQADPGTCQLTINNGASKVTGTLGLRGNYSPRNPKGGYWGKLAKNTPLRVRVERANDTFNRTLAKGSGWGTSPQGWSYTGTSLSGIDAGGAYIEGVASVNPSNPAAWDFEAFGRVSINTLPTASGDAIWMIRFRRSGPANSYLFWIDFASNGNLILFLQRTLNSVPVTLSSPTVATAIGLAKWKYRLKVEGGNIQARVWREDLTEPTTWQIDVSGEGAYTLDNTALGTLIQFTTSTASSPATTKWYMHDFRLNVYPFVGTVPTWPVRWDKSGNDSYVTVNAAGVLRRIQQGKAPLRSSLYSYMDSLNPSAGWALEDNSGATGVAAFTPDTQAGVFYESNPGGWDGVVLGGTSSQFDVLEATTISGTVPRMAPNGSWLAWFTFYMPVLPVSNEVLFRIRSSGTVVQWDIMCSPLLGGVIYLVGWNAAGTVVINESVTYVPGQWCIGQAEIQQSGSNLTGRIVRYQIGDGIASGTTSAPIAGDIGAPQAWSIYGSTGWQAGAAGPVVFYPFIPSVSIPTLLAAARGFAGEDAAVRAARLALERGVRMDLITGGATTPMGVQRPGSLSETLDECAVTDIALLTEFRGGLRFRSRGRRYGVNSRVTLDFAAGHIKDPPEPTDDDRFIRNDVTVERVDGGSARAIDVDSIAANDLYDTSVTVNPFSDAPLRGMAGWRLHLGTWDETRWPEIKVDLFRNLYTNGFADRVLSLEPGARSLLVNPPVELPNSGINLLVEGIKQHIEPYEWTYTLTCTPYGPWLVPLIAEPSTSLFNRIEITGSTLGSAETATAVGATDTWTITNAARNWSTTAVPFNWIVEGEEVTVTAISGSGTQTATVTRGVGGFTKTHGVGEEIHLAYVMIIGL